MSDSTPSSGPRRSRRGKRSTESVAAARVSNLGTVLTPGGDQESLSSGEEEQEFMSSLDEKSLCLDAGVGQGDG